jgi:predicted dehydrogenase
MNFAVIGSAHGHIYEFVEDMLGLNGEFIAVYDDKTTDIAKAMSLKYSVPLVEDMEEIFDLNIDIVGTSAVNSDKIHIVEECSKRGIHIIADKPLVVNKEQYKRLEKVIKDKKIQVGLMLAMRFMPSIYTLKKIISENQIGRLLNVEILTPHRLQAKHRQKWFFDKNKNGGVIVDLLLHDIDLFKWLAESTIDSYSGFVHETSLPENDRFMDSANFLVSSKSGVAGYLRTDWHMTDSHWTWGDLRIFCVGTNGAAETRVLGDPVTKEEVVVLYKEGQPTAKIPIEECKSSSTKDFLNRINGKDYMVSHEDILEASRLSIEFDNSAARIL